MKKIQMVDLLGQYEKIKPEVDKAILDVLSSTAFINGPEVKAFSGRTGKIPGSQACNTLCKRNRCAYRLPLWHLDCNPEMK